MGPACAKSGLLRRSWRRGLDMPGGPDTPGKWQTRKGVNGRSRHGGRATWCMRLEAVSEAGSWASDSRRKPSRKGATKLLEAGEGARN